MDRTYRTYQVGTTVTGVPLRCSCPDCFHRSNWCKHLRGAEAIFKEQQAMAKKTSKMPVYPQVVAPNTKVVGPDTRVVDKPVPPPPKGKGKDQLKVKPQMWTITHEAGWKLTYEVCGDNVVLDRHYKDDYAGRMYLTLAEAREHYAAQLKAGFTSKGTKE